MARGNEQTDLTKLEETLGHNFQDKSLLQVALTHPSLEGRENYQRLEFLGDRVLGLVLAQWLYSEFTDEKEGRLSRRFISLARKETLADVGETLNVAPFIRLATAGKGSQERNNPGVIADIVEAIIAALYLDGGLEAADKFIRSNWASALDAGDAARDPKTALQEIVQGRRLPLPKYSLADRTGPDHGPVFTMRVEVEGVGSATGTGTSKRAAESEAAASMLQELQDD